MSSWWHPGAWPWTISTIGFIAGGALIAAGAVVFFTGGGSEASPAVAVAATSAIGAGRAGISLSGAF